MVQTRRLPKSYLCSQRNRLLVAHQEIMAQEILAAQELVPQVVGAQQRREERSASASSLVETSVISGPSHRSPFLLADLYTDLWVDCRCICDHLRRTKSRPSLSIPKFPSFEKPTCCGHHMHSFSLRSFICSVCLSCVCVVDRVEIQCHTSVRLIRYALLVNC